jgi:NitT/TauT family transport system permease protein
MNGFPGKQQITTYIPSVIVFGGILIIWQLYVTSFRVPSFLLPPPSAILSRLFDGTIPWPQSAFVTTYEALVGFTLAAAFGVLIAVPMVLSKRLAIVAYPFIIAAQVMPKLAFVPILFIWLGFNDIPRVLTVFLVCFFPVVIDTVAGLSSLDPDMADLVRLQSPRKIDLLTKAMFPHALPSIFAGLKVSATLAMVGAVVAEFVSSNQGLGFLIVSAETQLNTALAFAAATILVVLGFLLYAAVELAERLVVPWKTDAVRGR